MGVAKQKKPLRRMKAALTGAPTSADFTVVLEDLRSNFVVFGEALQVMREEMGQRFEQVDRRFEQVDRRFDRVEGELGTLTTDMPLLKSAIIDLARENKGVRASVDDLAERIETRPDR